MSLPLHDDTPRVIVPPPVIFATVVVVGLLLDWLLPAYVLYLLLSLADRLVIGMPLIAAGALLAAAAIGMFRRDGTPAEPWKPTRTLVVAGVYRWLRNPMYVGALAFLAGLSIALAADWMLVLTIGACLVIHFGIVLREERYLAARFGERYTAYRAAVPRYGLRI